MIKKIRKFLNKKIKKIKKILKLHLYLLVIAWAIWGLSWIAPGAWHLICYPAVGLGIIAVIGLVKAGSQLGSLEEVKAAKEKSCPNCDSILDIEGDNYFCHGCGQVYPITRPQKRRNNVQHSSTVEGGVGGQAKGRRKQ